MERGVRRNETRRLRLVAFLPLVVLIAASASLTPAQAYLPPAEVQALLAIKYACRSTTVGVQLLQSWNTVRMADHAALFFIIN